MFIVEIHATSHIGRVRKGNEDNYLLLDISRARAWTGAQDDAEFVIESQKFEIDENGVVVAVSDGMGGALAAEEAETHTLKNVILQALGAQNEIYPISARIVPHRNDVFLLCSDGLSNKVTAASMQKIILDNFDKLENACVELVKEANENGGEDNITVIIAKFTGDSLPEPSGEDVKLELIDLGGIHDTAEQDDMDDIDTLS